MNLTVVNVDGMQGAKLTRLSPGSVGLLMKILLKIKLIIFQIRVNNTTFTLILLLKINDTIVNDK